jgi:hypothetical protein
MLPTSSLQILRPVSLGTMNSHMPIMAPESHAKSTVFTCAWRSRPNTSHGTPLKTSGNTNSSARISPNVTPITSQAAADSMKLALALFSRFQSNKVATPPSLVGSAPARQ